MNKKADLRIQVEIVSNNWSGDRSLEVKATIVRVSETGELESLSEYDSDDYGMAHLGVSCFAQVRYNAANNLATLSPAYLRPTFRDIYSANLSRLEAMVKSLRAIERKLESMETTYGYADDFAAYLARFAVAIGANPTHPFVRQLAAGETDYCGRGFRTMDAKSLSWHLGEIVKSFNIDRGVLAAD